MEGGICLRCGAPYEPEATVCYSCGAPIGETRSNTQPVPALRRIKPEAAEPEASSPSTPVAVSPTPLIPAPPSRPLTLPKRARKRPVWPVVALACVLVLGAFGGAAYVLRLVTASPNISQATVYTDPGHRFSFQRPTIWQVSATNDGVTIFDSNGTSTAAVKVRAANSGETAAEAADAIATPLGLSNEPQQMVGGASWERRAGQATGSDGAVRQYVVLATLRSGEIYTIEFTCPVSSFTGTDTLVYQPLLDSFRFGAAG